MNKVPRSTILVFLVSSLICIIWALYAGKDLNSDFLHYHLYAGLNAWHPRIGQDFMAAGSQGYFNPYAFALPYALIKANLPAWVIGSLLALIQSINLWICYLLAHRLTPEINTKYHIYVGVAACGLAALNPLMLSQLGTTYIDITTCIPVLAGLLLSLESSNKQHNNVRLFFAGLLMGVATGLKLSNAIFGVGLFLSLPILLGQNAKSVLSAASSYVIGGALGFILVDGYWAYLLAVNLQNPIFPFFNGVFGSDALPTIAARHGRFPIHSIWDALLMPLAMTSPAKGVYTELPLPDWRYAVLFVSIFASFSIVVWKKNTNSSSQEVPHPPRKLIGTTVFFLVSWTLWLITSANGRYMMPLSYLAGILIVSHLTCCLGNYLRFAGYAVGILMLVQLTTFNSSASFRFASGPWGNRWMDVWAPKSMMDSPHLFIETDLVSGAWIAPYIHPESALVQVVGQQALGLSGPGSRQLKDLLSKYTGRTYVTAQIPEDLASRDKFVFLSRGLDFRVQRLGLRIDFSNECDIFFRETSIPLDFIPKSDKKFSPSHPVSQASRETWALDLPNRITKDRDTWLKYFDSIIVDPFSSKSPLIACPVIIDPAAAKKYAQETKDIDSALDRIEKACPDIFSPGNQITERGTATTWSRYYSATDIRLTVYGNKEIHYIDTFRLGAAKEMGTVAEWLSSKNPPQPCQGFRKISRANPSKNEIQSPSSPTSGPS